jgi:hypothetical protein
MEDDLSVVDKLVLLTSIKKKIVILFLVFTINF